MRKNGEGMCQQRANDNEQVHAIDTRHGWIIDHRKCMPLQVRLLTNLFIMFFCYRRPRCSIMSTIFHSGYVVFSPLAVSWPRRNERKENKSGYKTITTAKGQLEDLSTRKKVFIHYPFKNWSHRPQKQCCHFFQLLFLLLLRLMLTRVSQSHALVSDCSFASGSSLRQSRNGGVWSIRECITSCILLPLLCLSFSFPLLPLYPA